MLTGKIKAGAEMCIQEQRRQMAREVVGLYARVDHVHPEAFSVRMLLMTLVVQAMSSVETGVVETTKPEIQTSPRPGQGDPTNDWLCFWCFDRVASEKDRIPQNGQSELSFKNPEGVRFNLLTFSRTIGCREAGVPTCEHTWFPGHAWSYCVCEHCGMHLGWYYTGPSEFVGLNRDPIVRASVMMS